MISKENFEIREAAMKFGMQYLDPFMQTLPDRYTEVEKVFSLLKEHGYMGLCVSSENGGKGYSYLQSALAYEGISYGDPLVGVLSQLHDSNILSLEQVVDRKGVAEKVKEMVRGEKLLAFAFTEASSGSDPSGNQGIAIKQQDGYHLTGEKHWTTLGTSAGYFLTFMNKENEKGMYLFLIDRDTPGMRIEPMDDLLYGNVVAESKIVFDNCILPAERMLSEEGHKLGLLGIDIARIFVPAVCVGVAQRALDECVSYLRNRYSMGSTILDKASIQFELATIEAKIEAARQLLYHTAELLDARDKSFSVTASKNKLFAPAIAQEATNLCVQLHGGCGLYRTGYPARALMSSKMFSIMDGTSEIQKFILGRNLRKNGGLFQPADCAST